MSNLKILLYFIALLSIAQPVTATESPAPTFRPLTQPGVTPTALLVYSIVPSQGEPGAVVTITGNAFLPGASVLIGGNPVSSRVIDNRHLQFEIPPMPAGQYALSVRSGDGIARSYSFQITPLRPIAGSLEPDTIAACNPANNRDVTIRGRNFTESSQLLFDGAIIRSRYQSSESITFSVPPVQGGLHQIAVKNGDAVSTPLGLSIITNPFINSITIGNNYVNQYELVIEGHNFHQNSVVMADGVRVGGNSGIQEERISVQDCSRIVYMRKPYSSTAKDLVIQVVNPAGEASASYTVTAP